MTASGAIRHLVVRIAILPLEDTPRRSPQAGVHATKRGGPGHRGRLWLLPGLTLKVAPAEVGATLMWGVPAPATMVSVPAPTVLIVDDHADFRAFARSLLEAAGFEVVGVA